MKKLFTICAALSIIGAAFAQQPQKPCDNNKPADKNEHRMGKPRGQHPFQELNLSDEQKQKIKGLRDEYSKKMADLQSNDKQALGDFKKKSAALRKEEKEKIEAVLTPEQKAKLDDMKKKGEEERKERAAKHLDKLKTKLNLSDDQVAKIKANDEDVQAKIKAIHENDKLLPEQKKDQSEQLRSQQREFFKSILTPEQQAKMDAIKDDKGKRKGHPHPDDAPKPQGDGSGNE